MTTISARSVLRPSPIRRYLTRFRTLSLPQHFTDVLVIGSGIAGLCAALEAEKSRPVMIVTKAALEESNTRYAQGGIAAQAMASRTTFATRWSPEQVCVARRSCGT
jgi:predicted oxidoreductase